MPAIRGIPVDADRADRPEDDAEEEDRPDELVDSELVADRVRLRERGYNDAEREAEVDCDREVAVRAVRFYIVILRVVEDPAERVAVDDAGDDGFE